MTFAAIPSGSRVFLDANTMVYAVIAHPAYGMAEDADLLAFLLELNLACAAKERAGEKITPPGLPLPPREQASFITGDCIEAPSL